MQVLERFNPNDAKLETHKYIEVAAAVQAFNSAWPDFSFFTPTV